MALRLRRDVQKSSYYVWFLGAEEAKGLRGPNIINPVIPYLIERSQKQEPLKVTLQVSHKGIKILQESSKHFIPHSAITSSIQRDDIVACVLLLYNPATKCPIHVHAYRCDSETTAEALNQQLQILINRQDNQKRFSELESRLGLTESHSTSNYLSLCATRTIPVPLKNQQRIPNRFQSSNQFISTLSSDTGISTRESEGSEDHLSSPPLKPRRELFDSLAAELRAKLKGNGPPLLLPPRDYDTVHRSKGNLTAIELRRCQNTMIVGARKSTSPAATPTTVKLGSTKQVSSRGSSGIGSDLAPSPERQQDNTSSEEDNWSNEADNSIDALKTTPPRQAIIKRYSTDNEPKDNYLRDLPSSENMRSKNLIKEIKNHNFKNDWRKKDDIIRPKLIRPINKNWTETDNYHDKLLTRKVVDEKLSNEYSLEENAFNSKQQQQQQSRQSHHEMYDESYELNGQIIDHKMSLTSRQEYEKGYVSKKVDIRGNRKYNELKNSENKEFRPEEPRRKLLTSSPERQRERAYSADRYHQIIDGQDYAERNPYKEPESLPYRESIEKMLKSPVMRYKSFDDSIMTIGGKLDVIDDNNANKNDFDNSPGYYKDANYFIHTNNNNNNNNNYNQYLSTNERPYKQRNYQIKQTSSPHPHENVLKVSFKERFQETKEKFCAMEKAAKHLTNEQQNHHNHHRDRKYDQNYLDNVNDNWNDNKQQFNRTSRMHQSKSYRRKDEQLKNDHHLQLQSSPIMNSKSLSNLVKGYRHSYAEPHPPPILPRSSGRVGLAAVVNPF